MRKKERRWTHLTIKLYLSHFCRLDRPKLLLFRCLKMVSEKFLLLSLFNFMRLCTWTSSQEQESNCQKHCEETVFFLAFPANIFRPRIFENKSKLLSANIIWTSESSDFFFFSLSIRIKLWAKEVEGRNTISEAISCAAYSICWPPYFWYILSLLWTLNVIAIKLIIKHIIKSGQCFLWITSLWNFNLYLNECSV